MVSVVLPCFNPPQDWELTVYHHFSRFTERIKEPAELIIVLDGPADMVPQSQLNYLIERLQQVHVVNNGVNYGKGYALRAAVQQAKGQLIIYTDIDFPYTHDSLYAVYDALTQQHCDIAVGTKNNDYYRHLTPIRRVISLTLQRLIRLFLAMPITDTQCGLKGFRREVAPLFLSTTINRYLFDLEFVRNAYRAGHYRLLAIPLQLRDDVQFRRMNYSILIPELFNFVQLLFKRTKVDAPAKHNAAS